MPCVKSERGRMRRRGREEGLGPLSVLFARALKRTSPLSRPLQGSSSRARFSHSPRRFPVKPEMTREKVGNGSPLKQPRGAAEARPQGPARKRPAAMAGLFRGGERTRTASATPFRKPCKYDLYCVFLQVELINSARFWDIIGIRLTVLEEPKDENQAQGIIQTFHLW